MDFSDFKRLLGADPRNRDPEFLRARSASPEFEEAAAEADRLEALLERAMALPVPETVLDDLRAIPDTQPDPRTDDLSAAPARRRFFPLAMAASLLIAAGAVGLIWNLNPHWDSVEDYVSDHYRHDGPSLLAAAEGQVAGGVQDLLAEFDVEALPALAGIVGVIKYCPTPDGRGVHMVLNSERGLVTVIYMPDTPVTDRERITFDDREAVLVALKSGSAAIIGSPEQQVSEFYALVQQSIVPVPGTT
jgi:hypothetical protein